jgi:threonine dehydrogenase-like Zn-dependent dehydrogenase
MHVVFDLLADPKLATPMTHTLPFERAPEAYELLDSHPDETMGVLLEYRD